MLSALVACGGEQAIAPLGRQPKKQPGQVPAKKVSVAKSHQVGRGESLYAIAWIYGLDYRDIATWNAIAEPYTIYPGQRLVLSSLGQVVPSQKVQTKTPGQYLQAPQDC